MGARAHYIIVENGVLDDYYSHWGDNSLSRDIFWGPQSTVEHLRNLDPGQRWNDDVWDVGAVLIDCDSRVLLFFGGVDLPYDAPQRNLYLRMLSVTWPNWTIRWAERAMLDLVEYLKLDPTSLLENEQYWGCGEDVFDDEIFAPLKESQNAGLQFVIRKVA